MKWFQENPFLAGLAIVTVLAAGTLGFFVSQAAGRYSEARDGYEQAVQKLKGLQNRVPFPSEDNLKKSQAQFNEYKEKMAALRKSFSARELPLDKNIGPQKFQDDLRAAVNDVVGKAAAAKVDLPKDFYLGFSQYANNLPTEAAAPELARELAVIRGVVQNLIDLKINAISTLTRTPIPQEGLTPAEQSNPEAANGTSEPPGGPQGRQGGRRNREGRGGLVRFPFAIAFVAEQSKFRVAFNSLLDSNQFLTVRAVTLENSSPKAPPVGSTAPHRPQGENSEEQTAAAPKQNSGDLNVILGREVVKVGLQLEMIDFPKANSNAK